MQSGPYAGRVIIDTSLWIEYFGGDTESSRKVAELVEEGRVVTVGPVFYELLQGVRSQKEASEIISSLLGVDYIEATRELWVKAGELSASLRRKGITLPISDVLIAAVAIKEGMSVYTLDSHFNKIPGLEIYK